MSNLMEFGKKDKSLLNLINGHLQQISDNLLVQDYLETDFKTVFNYANIREAASIIENECISAIPVIDLHRRLIGMLTAVQLVSTLAKSTDLNTPVETIINHEVPAVRPNTPLKKILDVPWDVIPVTDFSGRLLGIIKKLDILDDLVKSPRRHNITAVTNYYRLEEAFENFLNGVSIVDLHGNLLSVNRTYEYHTGLYKEEIVGKNMQDLVNNGVYDHSISLEVIKTCNTIISTQQVFKTGKRVLVVGIPIVDERGQIVRIINAINEICNITEDLTKFKNNIFNNLNFYFDHESFNSTHDLFDYLVINSKSMKDVVELAYRVARFEPPVLILGETGVGKDLISKFIHYFSERKNRPFIKVNCGAIPETLLEAELFGYEPGAFTGANRIGKPGLVEIAEGGTLMLDEIGEMPLSLQVKLLHLIQERRFARISGTKQKHANIRILAATNKDLEAMVAEKKFREDLYYRLNVVPITVPPLRERREDILSLAFVFLLHFNKKYGLNKKYSSTVLEKFLRYDWPGNVRQLENVIHRLVITTEHDWIADVDLQVCEEKQHLDVSECTSLKDAVERLEEELIDKALKKYRDPEKAAQSLGIHRTTLIRKKRKNKKLS